MVQSYLSSEHLSNLDDQCPMIALSSDVARSRPEVQLSYQKLLEAMVSLFEGGLAQESDGARQQALSLAALCVGGMVLARTLPDSSLAQEVQAAARISADALIQNK